MPMNSLALPSPKPRIRSHVRCAFVMRASASATELSYWSRSRSRYVKGIPNRDSLPKVASGNATPISHVPVDTDDMPENEPMNAVKPTFANACPLSEFGWYTVICAKSLNGPSTSQSRARS
eukprot:Amastigsp_a677407_86.p4 type:complete len:121 gc:universal Amastigsp_a677407_86:413-775(+)